MQPRKSSFALNVVKGAAVMVVLLSALGAFAGTESVLLNFESGGGPVCNGMVFDTKGNLYGTNGSLGYGVVFELTPPTEAGGNWTQTTLYSFDPNSTSVKDGYYPCGSLSIDAKGNLYGTTLYGGTNGGGTVWELTPPAEGSTTWTEDILYNFGTPGSGDGYESLAGVTLASSAATTLYGTTLCGGTGPAVGNANWGPPYGCSYGSGTVFELKYTKPTKKVKGGWKETVLYNFAATSSTDGALPQGALALSGKNLYGVTGVGGSGAYCVEQSGSGCGIAFELQSGTDGWTENVLYNFGATATDAEYPGQVTPVIEGKNIYGTTTYGGADPYYGGTVWELVYSASTENYTEQVLYSFGAQANDGCGPEWQVVMGKNADTWYGAAGGQWGSGGCGENGDGTLFELTYEKPKKGTTGGWTETSIYQFDYVDGAYPYDEVIKDQSGNLYGMTWAGGTGPGSNGVVFEFQP
jgi:uncharacterized repeat protein (TIGR03803 family)